MRRNTGIKPQDLVIVLFIALYEDGTYKLKKLSDALAISIGEVSASLNRSKESHLIGEGKTVFRRTLYEFLVYGIKVVFPVCPGSIVRGIPTAHSAPPLCDLIVGGNENYVWKHSAGQKRGMSIEPLYKTLPSLVSSYPDLYEICTLIDAIRIGNVREVNLARKELATRLKIDGN